MKQIFYNFGLNLIKTTRKKDGPNLTNLWCEDALHCTALHCTASTAMQCHALQCTAMHCTVLHCTVLDITIIHYIALHGTVLHCIIREPTLYFKVYSKFFFKILVDMLGSLKIKRQYLPNHEMNSPNTHSYYNIMRGNW